MAEEGTQIETTEESTNNTQSESGVTTAERKLAHLKKIGALTPEGSLAPELLSIERQIAAQDRAHMEAIRENIKRSGEATNLLTGNPGVIELPAEIQAPLWDMESAGFSPFNDDRRDLTRIGTALNSMVATDPDRVAFIQDHLKNRGILQAAQAAWNNANMYRGFKNMDKFRENMANYRIQSENLWGDSQRDEILRVSGVAECLVEIQRHPDYFREVKRNRRVPLGASSGTRLSLAFQDRFNPIFGPAVNRNSIRDNFIRTNRRSLGPDIYAKDAWSLAEKLLYIGMNAEYTRPTVINRDTTRYRPWVPEDWDPSDPVIRNEMPPPDPSLPGTGIIISTPDASKLGMKKLPKIAINLTETQIEGLKKTGEAGNKIFEAFIKGLS